MINSDLQFQPRILVADDDRSIRQLVASILRREGLSVDTVADGAEAIECLRNNEYAIVLLDLMMPRLDGFGVIEYLKENSSRRKPVVLIMTAYADQKFKKVDPQLVAGVLRKPFDIAELGNLIRLCVEGLHPRSGPPAVDENRPDVAGSAPPGPALLGPDGEAF
jgi:two-component system, chemotaxis family, chemotaxis protein CheY